MIDPLPIEQQRKQLESNQLAWCAEKYGKAYWRKGNPTVEPSHCMLPKPRAPS